MPWRLTPLFLAAAMAGPHPHVAPILTPRAVANDNRTAGGRMERDTLVLRLTVQWRPIAKDGFALPPAQAMVRPSIANVPTGETADFEFTPDAPGDLLLVVGPPNGAPQGSIRLRVSGRR